MGEPLAQAATVRVGGTARGTRRLAAVALALIGLAIVKPWAGAGPGPSPAPPHRVDLVALAPERASAPVQPDPSLGPDEIACLDGVELVSLVRLGTWNIREWLPIQLASADGPLDPALVPAILDGGPVRALGVCDGQAARPALPVLAAWQLAPRASPPEPVALTELPRPDAAAADGAPPADGARAPDATPEADGAAPTGASLASASGDGPPAVARLYRPARPGPGGRWPDGRYVLELRAADGSVRWLAFRVGKAGAGA